LTTQRRSASADLAFDAALFTVAFALRLWAGVRFAGEAVWDGHYYDFYAHRIAQGFGYSDPLFVGGVDIGHPSCHYPVGYSAVLGAFFWVLGEGRGVSLFFNALTGAALATVIRRCSAELGPLRSRLGGVLVAIHPGLVLYAALTMSETLSALCTFLALFAALRLKNHRSLIVRAALPAFMVGMSALVRPPALLMLPWVLPLDGLLALWKAKQRHSALLGFAKVASLGLGMALLPIAPWTARNCATMDGCALVSTNGGWNLAIGAFPRATGRFETLRGEDGCRDVTGQVQQDRCWFGVGLHYIATDTGRWLGLIPKKWSQTFDHESYQVGYLHEAKPAEWPEALQKKARAFLTTFHWLLCIAAAASALLVPSVRQKRELAFQILMGAALIAIVGAGFARAEETVWPALLFGFVLFCIQQQRGFAFPAAVPQAWGLVATVFATHAIFFGEDRYHVVATPALCLLLPDLEAGFARATHSRRLLKRKKARLSEPL
jgi:hypothetical protein